MSDHKACGLLEQPSLRGQTALHLACAAGNATMAKALVRGGAGAPSNDDDDDGDDDVDDDDDDDESDYDSDRTTTTTRAITTATGRR